MKGKGLFMMQQENKPRKKPEMPERQKVDLAVPLITAMRGLVSRKATIMAKTNKEVEEVKK